MEKTKMRLFVAETPSPRLYLAAPSIKKSTTEVVRNQRSVPAKAPRLYLTVRK